MSEKTCAEDGGCANGYSAEFFAPYRPVTALDMVQRVPGFQIEDGDETRGFGGASGNVLINGERPSAKSDTVSDILARIPAKNVTGVELLRGPFARSDLRGQTLVANVLVETENDSTLTWESGGEALLATGKISPFASASYVSQWKELEYLIGLSVERDSDLLDGMELLLDGEGRMLEAREEIEREQGREIVLNLGGQFDLAGGRVNINGRGALEKTVTYEDSIRTPISPSRPGYRVLQSSTEKLRAFEVGADFEKKFAADWGLKVVGLYRLDKLPELERLVDPDPADPTIIETSISNAHARQSEAIARISTEYHGLPQRALELSFEGARNTLRNRLSLMIDEGAGLDDVAVPGANTEVSEDRLEANLQDSWVAGAVTLESSLGFEASKIAQSGDASNSQSLFYLRPAVSALYARTERRHFQARFRREIAQLDFFDFVSAADFEDQDLALGNPELRPETTWVAEIAMQQRFGKEGALNLTFFRHWVSDVQDLLPLGDGDEVPGNIGDGRRWGVKADGALPLDWAALAHARLDFEMEWRRSRVVDPVTGLRRRFSSEQSWVSSLEFRQDFTEQQWAWGWDLEIGGPEFEFGLDEFERENDKVDLDIYWETSRFQGVKLRIELKNLLRGGDSRRRLRYEDARSLSYLEFEEARARSGARALAVEVSGTF
ncbi:TonB-dependent receptor domain-containing protein [Hyphococcus sp.]|uniref:TonB-dependent receptor domain-containing protein n=1 Tax=Hyphococcus sp. TaxID=2038636 RepID=UPI0035C6F641